MDQISAQIPWHLHPSSTAEDSNLTVRSNNNNSSNTASSNKNNKRRKRNLTSTAVAPASEDESSKLASTTSNELEQQTYCEGKRLRDGSCKDENGNSKAEAETSFGTCKKDQNSQPSEPPKQDYIHVRARRGQATDSHSLAERARREKISERMKILQDLVPGCNKVIGKASVLDEIINYIQALQCQVEFLSMKLEAVNARMSSGIEAFPAKEFGTQSYDAPSGVAFNSQEARKYGQGPAAEWLHMQVGGAYERVT